MSSYREVLRDGFEIDNFIRYTLLRFQIGDIDNMQKAGLNAGYPVVMLVMSSIEALSTVVLGKNGATAVESFFNNYMYQVNPLYGLEFDTTYKTKKSVRNFSLGKILYEFNRNWLTHSSGPLEGLPIDAREELKDHHLAMQKNGSILIHGYQLYYDFLKALDYFKEELDTNAEFLALVVDRILQFIHRVEENNRYLYSLISSQVRYKDSAIWINYPKIIP